MYNIFYKWEPQYLVGQYYLALAELLPNHSETEQKCQLKQGKMWPKVLHYHKK